MPQCVLDLFIKTRALCNYPHDAAYAYYPSDLPCGAVSRSQNMKGGGAVEPIQD